MLRKVAEFIFAIDHLKKICSIIFLNYYFENYIAKLFLENMGQ